MKINYLFSALAASVLFSAPASAASLLDSYEAALKHDKQLQSAYYESRIAHERYRQTVANLWPSFSFNASINIDQYRRMGIKMDESYKSYGIAMRQQVFKPTLYLAAKSEHKREQVAEYAYENARSELAQRLCEAYFNYQFAAQMSNLTKGQHEANEARLEQISKSFADGLVSKMDFLEAKIRSDKSFLDYSKARRDAEAARFALENITGEPAGQIEGISSIDVAYFEALDLSQFQGYANNLEYRQHDLNTQIAFDEVQSKQAEFFPQVDFSAQINDNRYQDERRFGDKRNEFSARLSVSMPLYTSGFLHARLQEAKFAQLAANSKKEHAAQEILLRQKRTVSEFSAALEQTKISERSLEHAKLYETAMERGHELGLKDLVELLDARARAYEARAEAIKSASALVASYLRLRALSGAIDEQTMRELAAAVK